MKTGSIEFKFAEFVNRIVSSRLPGPVIGKQLPSHDPEPTSPAFVGHARRIQAHICPNCMPWLTRIAGQYISFVCSFFSFRFA
jgi:hypothetical protein